jgi:diadenosine tetraphosphate (Ap4A) HIT family hydrolase
LEDTTIEGFNIGINQGVIAGQTIMHAHVHIIPRRKDDVSNPRGGIRNVIPGKGDY